MLPVSLPPQASASFAHTQARIASLIGRLAPSEGSHQTDLAGLGVFRISNVQEAHHGMLPPCFCMCAQGRKAFTLHDEHYIYGPGQYLVSAIDLPIVGHTLEATPEVPYLGLVLALDIKQIYSLLLETHGATGAHEAGRGLGVKPMDESLLEAVLRLLQLLERPRDLPVLGPLALREIYYLLLVGEQANQLRQLADANGHARRIAGTIGWLKQHYTEPVRIEDLAREAAMSPSRLHHHFKAVTALSPLQFVKQLRLQEARRLMLQEHLDAATAGQRVGYESASQFSREYRRQFGSPPRRDVLMLRDG